MRLLNVAHGKFPKFLYRAFENESYRDDFLTGKFRMGELKKYRDIEDASRQDQSEGEAVFKWKDTVETIHVNLDTNDHIVSEAPGVMTSTSSLGNPVHIFCTSTPDVDLDFMRERFGKYIVKITDPISFANDIEIFFSKSIYRIANGIRGCLVQYNKGEVIKTKPGIGEGMYLSYTQKPASFVEESEFRFVAVLFHEEQKYPHIDVNFGYKIDYAKSI